MTGAAGAQESRERVVVALTGGPEGDTLVRRAARIAGRASGDLLAVHVARRDGQQDASAPALAVQRALAEGLGGTYHVVVGDDVPTALLEFARAEDATQLVLGASRRGRLAALLGPGTGQTVARQARALDVHLVPHERVGRGRALPGRGGALSPRRRLVGTLLALVLLPALTAALTQARGLLALPSDLLLLLSAVVVVALVGGLPPALLAAGLAAVLANWWFTPPFSTLRVAAADDVVALVVFVVVAAAVATAVELAARRAREAARARAEAQALAALSGDVLRGERTLPALLERARQLFGLARVELHEGDRVVESAGEPVPGSSPAPVTALPVVEDVRLVLHGRVLDAGDRRVLRAFAAQAALQVERGRLAAEASAAAELAAVDRLRTALLAAVGHDLRTPLAAATAAVSSLRSTDVRWTPEDRDELLATAAESLDRLDRVVSDLLDMSRLQAGVLGVRAGPTALDEVVPLVLAHLPAGAAVLLEVGEDLPEVLADPGLLERALLNLTANALRHAPADHPVRLTARTRGDRVELRVVDRGPGVPDGEEERVFAPFQRLDDRASSAYGAGVGLGLAVARGFVDAMGGTLTAQDTPGGGLTMTVSLPVAVPASARSAL